MGQYKHVSTSNVNLLCMEILWFLTLLYMLIYAQLCLSDITVSLNIATLLFPNILNPMIIQHCNSLRYGTK
jgi:hypothetical protein